MTKVSRSSPQNNSEIIKNERDKEIPKEIYIYIYIYIYQQERQKIIDDKRLI